MSLPFTDMNASNKLRAASNSPGSVEVGQSAGCVARGEISSLSSSGMKQCCEVDSDEPKQ